MAKISILSEVVSNQIAAGEVVERPAAVVKELVENSIDAGASNIAVRFSRGGKQSIAVEDDGCGMDEEDALLSLKQHATSKIATIEDINGVSTFGFRGEALPSIASVSKFTMRTRTREGCGHEICCNGGKLEYARECGIPQGTIIQVEQLFHNVPARRKFLKTDQTESEHIIGLVKNLAFAERGIKFELFSDGRKIFQSPVENDWAARINQIFFTNERFLRLAYEQGNCSIEGVFCDPDCGTPCKRFFSFFVNRRPVESKLLRFTANDILGNVLPKHREIAICLLLTINPQFVDVNVHPTKREVKFRNEQFVQNCVRDAINAALHQPQQSHPRENTAMFIPPCLSTDRSGNAHAQNSGYRAPEPMSQISRRPILHSTEEIFEKNSKNSLNWKFIGKIFDNCVLFESETGMVVFNVRLAARKVLFEQFRRNACHDEQQGLLIPIHIQTSAPEAHTIDALAHFFAKKNIEIYQFDKNHYRISSIPAWLSLNQVENFVRDIIQASTEYDFDKNIESVDENFSKIAAKHAKYEQYATADDVCNLARELLECEQISRGTDGETPFFEIPKCDFLKRFSFL
jgi:DNA mismatch repair protein MutL